MSGRKLITLGCLVAAGLVLGAGVMPAHAQYYYYPAYAAPVYVAPPPVVYAPPPVVYAPPPVVYAPRVYGGFAVYGGYHRHHSFGFGFGYRHW